MRNGPGEVRTILRLYVISDRPSKQPLMVRTFLKVYMELNFYFVSAARTNKRHQLRATLEKNHGPKHGTASTAQTKLERSTTSSSSHP